MNDKLDLWVLGGDLRQGHLARQLALDGHQVHSFAMEKTGELPSPAVPADDLTGIGTADGVILPMPVSWSDGTLFAPHSALMVPVEDVLDRLNPHQFLCGGRVSPLIASLAGARGLTMPDYFTREELQVANCVPTAEGCLQLAMEHLPITLQGAQVLVLGYGRVGRTTAVRFAALGACVTAAARRAAQRAWAQADGLTACPFEALTHRLDCFDLVVNTVPARVLTGERLALLRRDCPIIELASAPGGVDPEEADRLGRTLIPASGLPGKTAPATAAAAIRQTICNMLQERESEGYLQ